MCFDFAVFSLSAIAFSALESNAPSSPMNLYDVVVAANTVHDVVSNIKQNIIRRIGCCYPVKNLAKYIIAKNKAPINIKIEIAILIIKYTSMAQFSGQCIMAPLFIRKVSNDEKNPIDVRNSFC